MVRHFDHATVVVRDQSSQLILLCNLWRIGSQRPGLRISLNVFPPVPL